MSERRLAVIDLGSNSFRLVVFTWAPGNWWKRSLVYTGDETDSR